VESLAAKVSPTWFLLLARVWPTVALIAVPFGTATIVVVCGALLETLAAFGVSAFLAVAAASLVAWFEQLAVVKRPATAAASQSLRWIRESNISHLHREYPKVNRRRWLVCPLRQVTYKPANGGYSLLI
jgi:hypothetical protein